MISRLSIVRSFVVVDVNISLRKLHATRVMKALWLHSCGIGFLVAEMDLRDWLRVMDILPLRTPRGGAEVTAGGHVPSTVVDGASVTSTPTDRPLGLGANCLCHRLANAYYWTSRQHNCRIRAPASSVTMRSAEGASSC